MELSKYVGRVVKIDLTNGYYYQGLVKSADENSIALIDKKNMLIELNQNIIIMIRVIE